MINYIEFEGENITAIKEKINADFRLQFRNVLSIDTVYENAVTIHTIETKNYCKVRVWYKYE